MGAWLLVALKTMSRHLLPILGAELLKRAPEIVSAIVSKLLSRFKKPKETERPVSEEKVSEILEQNKKEVENESLETLVDQSNAHFSKPRSESGDTQS